MLGFSREIEPMELYSHIHTHTHKTDTYRNWLTWLWRLRIPTICLLQAGELGKWRCDLVKSRSLRPGMRVGTAGSVTPSLSVEAWELGGQMSEDRWKCLSQLKERANCPSFTFLFYLESRNLLRSTHIGEGNLLYLVHQFFFGTDLTHTKNFFFFFFTSFVDILQLSGIDT